jgi:SAM-dependent methyltransferase
MFNLHFLYHLKNLVLRTPFRYGHYRRLKKYRNPSFDFEHNKHPLREKHYGKEGWKPIHEGSLHYRDYSSYDEYVTHQTQKFNEILNLQGGFDNRVILGYRNNFYRRFRYLSEFLDKSAVILSLGARQGTEVEVLWDLGYKNAIGLDLNPGPENPYVGKGDFMALEYPEDSVDMVYTNCVDHAFDLDKFFEEHARVLKPGGYAIYDVAIFTSGAGSFEAVEWQSEESALLLALKYYRKVVKVQTECSWKWMLLQK